MKLYYRGRNKKLKEATEIANKILLNENFYNEISSIKKFDNTKPADLKPSEIAELLKKFSQRVYVKTYFMPAGANAKTKRSKYFKMNTARLGRTISEITKTMIHEYVHCVDFGTKAYKFTHKDNDNSEGDEDNTAPWKIGSIALKMASDYTKT